MRALILFLLLAMADMAAASTEPLFDDSEKMPTQYPSWFKTSLLDLPEDLAEARAAGKEGLMLYFSTEGCSYCQQFLSRSLGDPAIAARVRAAFDVIGMEIFDDSDLVTPDGQTMSVNAFAERKGVQFSPALVFVDTQGRTMLRLTGYYPPQRFTQVLDYLEGGFHRQISLRNYLARSVGTPAADQSVHALIADPRFAEPPYALDRSLVAAERPLLVIFERNGCPDCSQLHRSVLADPEVSGLLEQFDLVRLDAEDAATPVLTPSGRRTNPAAWAGDLELTRTPALVFFDRRGRQVLTTDGLVLRQRMNNSLQYVLDKAYDRGMTYQRFARARALARMRD